MRLNRDTNTFDVSDESERETVSEVAGMATYDVSDIDDQATIDTVDSIVDLSVGVLADYGGEDMTRIARLARWVVHNLVGEDGTTTDAKNMLRVVESEE